MNIPSISVSRQCALNPVARAIERQRLRKWHQRTALELLLLQPGDDCASIATAAAEALACAIKAIEGFDDPDDVGGLMVEAMEELTALANAGFAWREGAADKLVEALDCAVQLLCESDPRTKLLAWRWARDCQMRGLLAAADA